MKKSLPLLFILTLIFTCVWNANAQDMIVKTDGTEVESSVVEITDTHVKYKKFSNPNGPVYNIPIADVFFIKYQNGEKEVFRQPQTQPATATPAQPARPAATSAQSGGSILAPVAARVQPTVRRAEGPVSGGFKIGGDLSTMSGFSDDIDKNGRFGFTGGLFMNIRLLKFLYLQPELLYTMKGINLEYETSLYYVETGEIAYENVWLKDRTTLGYIELPVNLKFAFALKSNRNQRLFIGGGPYVAYGVHGMQKYSYTNIDTGEAIVDNLVANALKEPAFNGANKVFSRFDFGINMIAGYEDRDLYVAVSYSLGLTDISLFDRGFKNRNLAVSIGVKF